LRGTSQLFRLLTEVVFILAGALLLWVGITGRYWFNARGSAWLLLAAALIFWGLRAWRRARLTPVRSGRVAAKIGGSSLVLAGLIMLLLAWMPLSWAGLLLALTGGAFVVRGLANAAILALAS
jgi:hypothetical protein